MEPTRYPNSFRNDFGNRKLEGQSPGKRNMTSEHGEQKSLRAELKPLPPQGWANFVSRDVLGADGLSVKANC